MENKKLMEGINNETVGQVYEEVVNSNGNLMTKLAVGAVVAAIGVGTLLIYKKRKQKRIIEAECVEEYPEEIEK